MTSGIFRLSYFIWIMVSAACAETHVSRKVTHWIPPEHLSHYYHVYENAPKDIAIHGAYALRMGAVHKEALASANQLISSGMLLSFIDGISIAIPPASDIITVYLDVWQAASKDHRRNTDMHVNSSTALAIHSKEYTNLGVYEELGGLQNRLAEKMYMYGREKYKNTHTAFDLYCELIAMAKKPSGSFKSFRGKRQRILVELGRVIPLAEREHL